MHPSVTRPTARTTGLLYLALAVFGIPAFLIIRPMLFDPTDATTTAANLVDQEALARLGVALELALVAAQTLTALWFFRLFRRVDSFAAAMLAVFGTINAVAILTSAAALGAALDAALAGDPAGSQLMYLLSGNLWGVGALFFGLWLIPMGLLARRAGMPRPMAAILLVGGLGYIADAFLSLLAPGADLLSQLIVVPATVGEFWMIGYLLWTGLRPVRTGAPVPTGKSSTRREVRAEP
ncbi:DUF4386 domain-containing protein [Isoptericola halotolerans]|uniref:DUF4386 domain-containing protein n=1 Tax=Isoptericola halotolerans TaxID=300560 RepID=A0ABX2A7P3_9MICO|nr:DUF4386 domain-containing protein [Isoptericola halotolerans]NOV98890.1 hypothetical protein [Isoptericola halotolerans]